MTEEGGVKDIMRLPSIDIQTFATKLAVMS